MKESTPLDPCPFCGSAPVEDGKSESLRIRCWECGVQGPVFDFDADSDESIEKATEEAIAHWNHRSTPAHEGGARDLREAEENANREYTWKELAECLAVHIKLARESETFEEAKAWCRDGMAEYRKESGRKAVPVPSVPLGENECPECGGVGEYGGIGSCGDIDQPMDKCDTCSGTGFIEPGKAAETKEGFGTSQGSEPSARECWAKFSETGSSVSVFPQPGYIRMVEAPEIPPLGAIAEPLEALRDALECLEAADNPSPESYTMLEKHGWNRYSFPICGKDFAFNKALAAIRAALAVSRSPATTGDQVAKFLGDGDWVVRIKRGHIDEINTYFEGSSSTGGKE